MAYRVQVPYWDNHFHGRRGPVMMRAMPLKAQRCCGGVYEPNTNPHLTTYDEVIGYQEEITEAACSGTWVGSVYLTNEPSLSDTERLWKERRIAHIKRYPTGGSTNTNEAPPFELVLDKNSKPGRQMCQAEELGIPVKEHPEDACTEDAYHREGVYFREMIPRLMDAYPNMRWIQAHLSTNEGVDHMLLHGDPHHHICELTAHHLFDHRRILFDGGALLPNHHCLPVIKSKFHWLALRRLLKRRAPYVVAGSDAAAHLSKNKYGFHVFGGLFTYHCDLEMYVQTLMELGIFDFSYDFLYGNAQLFHDDLVPDDPRPVELVREAWTVHDLITVPGSDPEDVFTPFGYHPDPEKRHRFQWKIVG